MSWLSRSKGTRQQLGGHAETAAAEHFTQLGGRVLSRNFRCGLGELDLVVLDADGATLVFAEVKSGKADAVRTSPEFAPELRVGPQKQRTLTRLAEYYLQRHGLHGRPARFDVIAVLFATDGSTTIRHYRDAFPAQP